MKLSKKCCITQALQILSIKHQTLVTDTSKSFSLVLEFYFHLLVIIIACDSEVVCKTLHKAFDLFPLLF